jgi:hypothetical protein
MGVFGLASLFLLPVSVRINSDPEVWRFLQKESSFGKS